jgi:mono/diheme cytochrome c family protein
MKKVLKVVGYLLLLIIIIIVGLLTYAKVALPNVGDAPEMTIERTPERIERGKYLANHVSVCIDCHSNRDWSRFSGPITEGTFGMGGDKFDHQFGFPGTYYAKNITPAGISRYTDGELFRVITTGVNKEGRAMFPVMPYPYFGKMDEEDIKSIIAYIRTLPEIKNEVPESASDFPMNFIVNTIPGKAAFTKRPEKSDVVNYGKYMVNASGCIECHTQVDKGQIIPELAFSGGREFPIGGGRIVRSANITPETETGIGSWSKDRFVELFKSRADSSTLHTKIDPNGFNSMMPWTMYGGMAKEDLEAIYTYLRTLKPMKNTVEKFTPAN